MTLARRTFRFLIVAVAAALLVFAGWLLWKRMRPPIAAPPSLSVLGALGPGANDDRFARAVDVRSFQFPQDHGPHAPFRTEWWYWTGDLDGPDGRRFGYQFTVFRSSLDPDASPGPRERLGRERDLHGALRARGRLEWEVSRVRANVAGRARPRRCERVSVSRVGPRLVGGGLRRSGSRFPWHLRAENEGVAIDLRLEQGKPVVLHGNRGLSPKGTSPGNASYYYSLTRMPTSGSVLVGGQRWDVRGESWMDREWSTSALEADQVGWDWLALQLDDDRELMLFRLRRKDGSLDPMSGGSLIDRDGTVRRLRAGDFRIEALDTWKSSRSDALYPTSVRVLVPGAPLDLRITPLVPDQELDVSFRYWEGAVRVEGRASDRAITGRGYLELTGYGEITPPAR